MSYNQNQSVLGSLESSDSYGYHRPRRSTYLRKGDSQVKEIPLTQGKIALVDDEDYEMLMQWKWHAYEQKGTWRAARAVWDKENKKYHPRYIHQELLVVPEGFQVDHINRNPLDNRKSNLRVCTFQQNLFNHAPRRGSTSKYKGVSWHKRNKNWQATIRINKTQNYIGSFKNEEDAARAYDKYARLYFGEFAYLNFPEDAVALALIEILEGEKNT